MRKIVRFTNKLAGPDTLMEGVFTKKIEPQKILMLRQYNFIHIHKSFFNHSKYVEYMGREGHILKFGEVVNNCENYISIS